MWLGFLYTVIDSLTSASGLPMVSKKARSVKESIYIRVNNPTLNRNVAKFDLQHIFQIEFSLTPLALK